MGTGLNVSVSKFVLRSLLESMDGSASQKPRPVIEVARFSRLRVSNGGIVAVVLSGRHLDPTKIDCVATTRGFTVSRIPGPPPRRDGEELLLFVRVFRGVGTTDGLCNVRFSAGERGALASIGVTASLSRGSCGTAASSAHTPG